MLGVVKFVPVPRLVPPVLTAYQSNVPAFAVALKITVPMPQRLFDVVLVTEGLVFIVAITDVRVADVQPPLVAST